MSTTCTACAFRHCEECDGHARLYGVGSYEPVIVECSCASVGHVVVLRACDPSHEDYDPAGNDQEDES